MSEFTAKSQSATSSPLKRLLNRYPLVSFFVIAFAGAWLALLPLVLDTHGFGLLPITFPDMVLFPLASIAGPTLASFVMTAATSGKAGVRQLLRRYVLWRVGIQWYLLAIFSPVLVLLVVESILLGATPLNALLQKWPLIFSSYLPNVLLIVLVVQVFEEGGWSGFALPRLQRKYGAVLAACILGILWALWHLPTFFINSFEGSGKVPLPLVLPSLGLLLVYALPLRIIWTWVFNNTKTSILIAILLHAAADAAITLVFFGFLNVNIHLSGWQAVLFGAWDFRIAYAVLALLVILFTRGHLSYKPGRVVQPVETPRPAETPPANV